MGFVAQNAVAHVIVVGNLNVVKKNHVFQLHGVADNTVRTDQRTAPDKGAVPYLGAGPDDAGRAKVGGGGDNSGFVDPDLGSGLVVFVGKSGAKLQNQILDSGKGFPGVVKAGKIMPGKGMAQIIQFVYGVHDGAPSSGTAPEKLDLLYYALPRKSIHFEKIYIFKF